MIRAITSFGFVGLSPIAPGTAGSLAALPAGYLLHVAGGFPALLVATLAVFALGLWATARFTAGDVDPDRSEIVIDEVVGQWIALFPLSAGLWFAGADPWLFPWPGWVGAFVMFRLFDIAKPWPINRVDAMNTPMGVMFDDVMAGAFAAAVVTFAAWVAHGMPGA